MKFKSYYNISIVILSLYAIYMTWINHDYRVEISKLSFNIKNELKNSETQKIILEHIIKNNYIYENTPFPQDVLLTNNFSQYINISSLVDSDTYFIYIPDHICQNCIRELYTKVLSIRNNDKNRYKFYFLCSPKEFRIVKNIINDNFYNLIFAIKDKDTLNCDMLSINDLFIFKLNENFKVDRFSIIDRNFIYLLDSYTNI